jgi:hypothetical protein
MYDHVVVSMATKHNSHIAASGSSNITRQYGNLQ